MSVSSSDPGMYRIVSEELPTLFLDESEITGPTPTAGSCCWEAGRIRERNKGSAGQVGNDVFKIKDSDNYRRYWGPSIRWMTGRPAPFVGVSLASL